ncbi:serine hydrolase domain-containing protein [Altererythrobacter lutimaris]|uniref:Serine hydrolase n=1 Tax=Altererythrobacter lutimaris TaxID=2743979 RepID=A0A850HG01_9SPHN|nr:serine hydrolase [Altererythrobacter lutimaris]NVE93492.1 serine hydrolase [Altererythrobacter lutimaris]
MTREFKLLTAVLAIALAGCSAVEPAAPKVAATSPPAEKSYPDQAELYSDLDNPMRPDEFQGATILDVDRYRPTYNLTGCEAAPLPVAEPTPALSQALAKAKAYSEEASGVGLIVMVDGAVVHESYANGADENSLTTSASKMKSVLALLYGIAIEQGHIGSIDDSAGAYLDEWTDDPRGAITLRQLMTMSAGLGPTDFMQLIFAPDIAPVALQAARISAPDTEFNYSNANSRILAIILDRQVRAAGFASLAQFLQAELWCPLGGSDALLWVDPAGKARGYAGLHAILRDWARVGDLIRNNGTANGKQIVPAEWIAEMAKPSAVNSQYGLHVWLGGEWTPQRSYSAANPIKITHSEAFEAKDIIYFDGFGGQRVYVMPSEGVTIARSGLVNMQFDDAILPNTVARAVE